FAFRKTAEVNDLSLVGRGRPRPIGTPDNLLAGGCDLCRRDAKSSDVEAEVLARCNQPFLRIKADTADLDATDLALADVFKVCLVHVPRRDGEGSPAAIE